MAASLPLSKTLSTPLPQGKNPGWWRLARIVNQEACAKEIFSQRSLDAMLNCTAKSASKNYQRGLFGK